MNSDNEEKLQKLMKNWKVLENLQKLIEHLQKYRTFTEKCREFTRKLIEKFKILYKTK